MICPFYKSCREQSMSIICETQHELIKEANWTYHTSWKAICGSRRGGTTYSMEEKLATWSKLTKKLQECWLTQRSFDVEIMFTLARLWQGPRELEVQRQYEFTSSASGIGIGRRTRHQRSGPNMVSQKHASYQAFHSANVSIRSTKKSWNLPRTKLGEYSQNVSLFLNFKYTSIK